MRISDWSSDVCSSDLCMAVRPSIAARSNATSPCTDANRSSTRANAAAGSPSASELLKPSSSFCIRAYSRRYLTIFHNVARNQMLRKNATRRARLQMRVHKPGLPVYWTGRPMLTTASLGDPSPVTVYDKLLRQLAAQLAAAHITAPAHADLKPQLAGAITQDRFHLGIALKAFRHARHLLASLLAARHVTDRKRTRLNSSH